MVRARDRGRARPDLRLCLLPPRCRPPPGCYRSAAASSRAAVRALTGPVSGGREGRRSPHSGPPPGDLLCRPGALPGATALSRPSQPALHADARSILGGWPQGAGHGQAPGRSPRQPAAAPPPWPSAPASPPPDVGSEPPLSWLRVAGGAIPAGRRPFSHHHASPVTCTGLQG